MEAPACTGCLKPKAPYACALCDKRVCKTCAQFVRKDSFAYLEAVAAELQHEVYCGPCFDTKVSPSLEAYRAAVARAKNVCVFFKAQSEETRTMRRSAKPFRVTACPDRDETVMRLAFFAAQAGFNGLVDVALTPKKVRNEGYQTMRWDGSGVPVHVDEEKLNRPRRPLGTDARRD